MRIQDEDDDDRPELNVTPLIDCLFFLLTFFIMTSTLQEAEKPPPAQSPQQLLVELPEAIAARSAKDPAAPVVVTVDAVGHFFVDYTRVGIEELHRQLRSASTAHRRIRIEGDRHASFQDIARVIDLCEFEGLRDIAVRTRDEK